MRSYKIVLPVEYKSQLCYFVTCNADYVQWLKALSTHFMCKSTNIESLLGLHFSIGPSTEGTVAISPNTIEHRGSGQFKSIIGQLFTAIIILEYNLFSKTCDLE